MKTSRNRPMVLATILRTALADVRATANRHISAGPRNRPTFERYCSALVSIESVAAELEAEAHAPDPDGGAG